MKVNMTQYLRNNFLFTVFFAVLVISIPVYGCCPYTSPSFSDSVKYADIVNGTLYIVTVSGDIYAFDPCSGRVLGKTVVPYPRSAESSTNGLVVVDNEGRFYEVVRGEKRKIDENVSYVATGCGRVCYAGPEGIECYGNGSMEFPIDRQIRDMVVGDYVYVLTDGALYAIDPDTSYYVWSRSGLENKSKLIDVLNIQGNEYVIVRSQKTLNLFSSNDSFAFEFGSVPLYVIPYHDNLFIWTTKGNFIKTKGAEILENRFVGEVLCMAVDDEHVFLCGYDGRGGLIRGYSEDITPEFVIHTGGTPTTVTSEDDCLVVSTDENRVYVFPIGFICEFDQPLRKELIGNAEVRIAGSVYSEHGELPDHVILSVDDGEMYVPLDPNGRFEYYFDPINLSDGPHTLSCRIPGVQNATLSSVVLLKNSDHKLRFKVFVEPNATVYRSGDVVTVYVENDYGHPLDRLNISLNGRSLPVHRSPFNITLESGLNVLKITRTGYTDTVLTFQTNESGGFPWLVIGCGLVITVVLVIVFVRLRNRFGG
ncbi:hypothetical protein J7K41_02675 [Candidatus Micrarchaeota archaeon]|nr:hypothetical protein [Candidatus Micrarchaeota archaeon]